MWCLFYLFVNLYTDNFDAGVRIEIAVQAADLQIVGVGRLKPIAYCIANCNCGRSASCRLVIEICSIFVGVICDVRMRSGEVYNNCVS